MECILIERGKQGVYPKIKLNRISGLKGISTFGVYIDLSGFLIAQSYERWIVYEKKVNGCCGSWCFG